MERRTAGKLGLTAVSLVLMLGLLFGFASSSSAASLVYQGLDKPLNFVTGVYQLAVGPLNVKSYTQIRVNAFGSSGSGTILVQVVSTDKNGVNLGLLEQFTLDFQTSAGSTATKVYEVPGQYVMVYFQAGNPDYVSLVVFGK